MPRQTEPFVAGLVLGAGGSSRLGRPKQLLAYGEGTLLGHVVGVARACAFDQLVVAIGGSADEVRAGVDLAGADVVVNDGYGAGCSSSIAAALDVVDPRCQVLVLMLGDQPGVTAAAVAALLEGPRWCAARHLPLRRRARAPDRVRAQRCSPTWPASTATRASGACSTSAPARSARSRPGLDTARRRHPGGLSGGRLRAGLRSGRCMTPAEVTGEAGGEVRRLVPDVETLAQRLAGVDYLVDEGLATSMFVALRLPQPLLLEGEAGVGKTEAARSLAAVLDTPLIRLQCYEGIDAAEAL